MAVANVINSSLYVSNFKNDEKSMISIPVTEYKDLYQNLEYKEKNIIEKYTKNKNSLIEFKVYKKSEVPNSVLFFNVRKNNTEESIINGFKESYKSIDVFQKIDIANNIDYVQARVLKEPVIQNKIDSIMTVVNDSNEYVKYESIGRISTTVSNSTVFNVNTLKEATINIDKFSLTIQLTSFMEYNFDFNEKKVDAILGLPNGVEFNKAFQKLHGSPTVAGNYDINIIFTDNTSLNGKIKVPKVKRDL